ncbi:hypothetical protein G5714_000714 [Onychostoma macrolepis]|uniref:Uncharacterized protein n=1 Tax=Onychostoma macrolepis TaxID=369639 RepID=A0A7J6DH45_9TELE|nr:hypothetical protein G5714_000714 [Onychostoma macrolepis]
METANHSMEMEKRQTAISSSSKRDKGTFPKDTPCSEFSACYREGSNRSTRSESPACKGETLTDQPSSESSACYREGSNRSTSSESSACYREGSIISTRSESLACKGDTLTDQPSSEYLAQRGRRHTDICNKVKLQRANLHSKILGPFGAPGDQHPPVLHVQGCRNGFLLLSPLHCYQHNQWVKSPPPDCSLDHR